MLFFFSRLVTVTKLFIAAKKKKAILFDSHEGSSILEGEEFKSCLNRIDPICLYKYRGVNIDQSALCYISMDLSRQALQAIGNFSSNLGVIF